MMGNKSEDNQSGRFPTSGLYGTWRLSLLLLVAQSCLTLCDPMDNENRDRLCFLNVEF